MENIQIFARKKFFYVEWKKKLSYISINDHMRNEGKNPLKRKWTNLIESIVLIFELLHFHKKT